MDAKFSFGVNNRVSAFTCFEHFLHLFEIPILCHVYESRSANFEYVFLYLDYRSSSLELMK
jgi:hypothetical protein